MKSNKIALVLIAGIVLIAAGCKMPPPDEKKAGQRIKHNYIVLLDLSDRLIIQDDQPNRDKQIIQHLYTAFEKKVRHDLYIKSRDEIKVVIAPQRGTSVDSDVFEDRLYVNMQKIQPLYRRAKEEERRNNFVANLDTLYKEAAFSKNPKAYHGADIWKYFYEDLKVDYSADTLTDNFLFILTDGYPIVGSNQSKLRQIKNEFPDLHIVLLEASPREKDMEWDRVMSVWEDWFKQIGIKKYTLIKRGSIRKELEQVEELLKTES